jgi:hypothetical protein
LLRENKKVVHCIYIPIKNEGIELLPEICFEDKMEILRMAIINFPSDMMEIAASLDVSQNDEFWI